MLFLETELLRTFNRQARGVKGFSGLFPDCAAMSLWANISRCASGESHHKAPCFRNILPHFLKGLPSMLPVEPLDPLLTAQRWREDGRDVAIATVIETWGSAPRPAGSNLVIDAEGNFEGSVSGGCVEGAVITEALDVIGSGMPKMLEFGVADETAWQVGLSCGGRIRVYVERLA
jgi:hypothetical protein